MDWAGVDFEPVCLVDDKKEKEKCLCDTGYVPAVYQSDLILSANEPFRFDLLGFIPLLFPFLVNCWVLGIQVTGSIDCSSV